MRRACSARSSSTYSYKDAEYFTTFHIYKLSRSDVHFHLAAHSSCDKCQSEYRSSRSTGFRTIHRNCRSFARKWSSSVDKIINCFSMRLNEDQAVRTYRSEESWTGCLIDTQQETSERIDLILVQRLVKKSVQHVSAKNSASSKRQAEHVGHAGSPLFLILRSIKY